MFQSLKAFAAPFLVMTVFALLGPHPRAAAQDAEWRVSKTSGEAWVTTRASETTPIVNGALVKPGDSVRTGQTGRVLLARNKETILVSPNSVVELPAEQKDGLATTIVQRAGSILLDVEKKNVKHFEVETPYLAAVVKGTRFRVSLDEASARVDVLRGQVEVMDFKSGQQALVESDQVARVSTQGAAGLSLSGSGTFNPIVQNSPRAPRVSPVEVPKEGFTGPAGAEKVAAVAPVRTAFSDDPSPRAAAGAGARASWLSWFGFSRKSGAGDTDHGLDDLFIVAAIPLSVGFVVAVVTGIARRRKRIVAKTL